MMRRHLTLLTVLATLLTFTAPAFAQTSSDYFLHGTGPDNNPPTLVLNTTAPTATAAKFRDSAGVNFSGGNAWKDIGTWPAAAGLTTGTLTGLSDLHVWLGLKNSDDQGTQFDVRADVLKNGSTVATGLTRCITGIVRNAANAKAVTVAFGSVPATPFNGTTDTLSVKISTRIGTNPDETKCPGHNNAVGLRLYFDATSRNARFDATLATQPTPTIANVTPVQGPVGTSVTITGANFDPVPANNTVQFNGVTASVSSATATTLVATVPSGATTGPLTVTTAAGTATSATNFTVTLPPPTLTGFTPATGTVGTVVTITGTNFGTIAQGGTIVRFNGTAAVATSVTATSLTTTVPLGATTGTISVQTSGGTATSATPFTVNLSVDFQLSGAPGTITAVQGRGTTTILQMTSAPGFANLVNLVATGLPAGATAVFSAPVLSLYQPVTLTLNTSGTTPTGTVPVTLTGTTTIDGRTIIRTATVNLSVIASGTTTFSGRLLRSQDELPLVGATIKLGTQTTVTDASGRYLFTTAPIGDQILTLDGSTVTSPPGVYHLVPFKVTVSANQANELPFVSYLPAVETTHISTLNPAQSSVVQDPSVPGYSMTIPAGVELRSDVDGSLITQMSITRVSPDRLPSPPPPAGSHFDPASVYMTYFFKPGGAIPTTPISQFSLPNDGGALPGTQMIFWHYVTGSLSDPAANKWRLAGTGKVSADGKIVIPDPGTTFTKFCCGQQAVCPAVAQAAGASNPGPTKGGDPVDLATGQFHLSQTDYVLPGRVPIIIDRTYLSAKVGFNGPFGKGTNSTYEIRAEDLEDGRAMAYTQADGRLDILSIQPDGTFKNTEMVHLQGTVLTKTSDGSRTVRHKDGRLERFNTLGRIIGLEDRNGNAITIERNASDFLTRILDAGGRVLTIGTNAGGRITSIQDPIGRQVFYSYTANDLLETVTDTAGGMTRYTYDATGRMLTVTDPRGITYLTNEYDAEDRVTRQTMADGGIYRFTYGTFGTSIGEAIVTDPRGQTTRQRFTNLKYPDASQDGQGQTVRNTYDPVTNRVLSARDSLNRITQYTYDANGNVTSVIDPLGNTTLFEYESSFNKITKITDPLNQITRFTYDPKGDLLTTTDPLNHTTTVTYNEFGQPLSATDPLNQTTTFVYDVYGNLIATTDPLGNRTQRTYDAVNRLIALTDPRGKSTGFLYDGLNRVTQIQDATTGLTRFTYDPNGNLLTVQDAKNQTTTYTYDNLDRLLTRKDALNRQDIYQYDAAGNLTMFTDRKNQVATFSYDNLNRRIGASYADGSSTSFIYDAVGRLSKPTDSLVGAIDFLYDNLDRLSKEISAQGVVEYAYDAIGRRTTMTPNGQQAVTYGYDAASRLIQVAQAGIVVGLSYDTAGRRTGLTYPNGTSTSYSYDNASRLTNIIHQGPVGLIESLGYAYDAAGNRISLTRTNGTASNLPVAVQAAYDAANEQVTFNGFPQTFDANGNQTTSTDATGTTTYTWDARNRLVAQAGPDISTAFQYDVLGRRSSKTVNGVTTQYLYDGKDIVQDIGNGAVGASYVRGGRIDEPFVRQASNNEYYHSDALGSAVALSNAAGAATVSYSYEAFGKTTMAGNSTNPFQYTGRENDGTGLYFYRARHYSPGLHRFLSEDPILAPFVCLKTNNLVWLLPQNIAASESDLSQALNAFVYVKNNAMRFLDPSGLKPCDLQKIQDDCRAQFEVIKQSEGGSRTSGNTLAQCSSVFFGNVGATRQCGRDKQCLARSAESDRDVCLREPGAGENLLRQCTSKMINCLTNPSTKP